MEFWVRQSVGTKTGIFMGNISRCLRELVDMAYPSLSVDAAQSQ